MNFSSYLTQDRLVIFLLHGVVNRSVHSVRNYTRKHLEKDYFIEIMKELAASGHALSMDEVMYHHSNSEPYPPRSFAVTFDDGFENNYSVAAPILKDLKIPAAFYISTGLVDANGMSWTDKLELCLEGTSSGKLHFPWEPSARSFGTSQEKIEILTALRAYVKNDRTLDTDGLVEEFFRQCAMDPIYAGTSDLDLKLNWNQVRALHADPDFIVGGHSHVHAVLAFLKDSALEDEISTSLQFLREKAGIISSHYSYPEGLAHCFDNRVIASLKAKGIRCCPTAMPGDNDVSDDLFHLRRIFVI